MALMISQFEENLFLRSHFFKFGRGKKLLEAKSSVRWMRKQFISYLTNLASAITDECADAFSWWKSTFFLDKWGHFSFNFALKWSIKSARHCPVIFPFSKEFLWVLEKNGNNLSDQWNCFCLFRNTFIRGSLLFRLFFHSRCIVMHMCSISCNITSQKFTLIVLHLLQTLLWNDYVSPLLMHCQQSWHLSCR